MNHHPLPYTVAGHRKLKVKEGEEEEEAHLYAGHAKVLTLPVVVLLEKVSSSPFVFHTNYLGRYQNHRDHHHRHYGL